MPCSEAQAMSSRSLTCDDGTFETINSGVSTPRFMGRPGPADSMIRRRT
jgi:hypothetical protein